MHFSKALRHTLGFLYPQISNRSSTLIRSNCSLVISVHLRITMIRHQHGSVLFVHPTNTWNTLLFVSLESVGFVAFGY